jgi:hypothetical protein
LNTLLNSTNGTLSNDFTGTSGSAAINAALLTTTDYRTFLVVDVNGTGTFTTAADMLIEITGSTLTSVTTASFV